MMFLSRRLFVRGAAAAASSSGGFRLCAATAGRRRPRRPRPFPLTTTTTTAIAGQVRGIVTSIGILRESYDPWERRAPLCPRHVEELLSSEKQQHSSSIKRVFVQPSSQRVFSDREYEAAGAIVQEDLSSADLLLGVKRPKAEDTLLPNKPHVFFSHVVKGQPENMLLLQTILDKKIQLVDYECIVEHEEEAVPPDRDHRAENNNNDNDNRVVAPRRLVAFGKHAGLAGMLNTFYPLGMRIMDRFAVATPFLNCPTASMHHDLQQARDNIERIGRSIQQNGLPITTTSHQSNNNEEPLVICVTGKGGNVHNGAMEILRLLPHEIVTVADLPNLFLQSNDNKKIYIVTPTAEELYEHKEGDPTTKEFRFRDFVQHPQDYRCVFAERIAPYAHALVNCIYWDPRFPRLLTKEQARELHHDRGLDRLLVVSDISCDINGSIEFLERSTTIPKPYYNYDPFLGREVSDHIIDTSGSSSSERQQQGSAGGGSGGGITVMGVDILPTELPRESSNHFGDALMKLFGQSLLLSNNNTTTTGDKGERESVDGNNNNTEKLDMSRLSPTWADACITTNDGKLRPRFQYLDSFLKQRYKNNNNNLEDPPDATLVVFLHGHLFDSGLINQILDGVEACRCYFEFDSCHMGKSVYSSSSTAGKTSSMSSAVLRIKGSDPEDLERVETLIQTLVDVIPKANASMKIVEKKGKAVAAATIDEEEEGGTTAAAGGAATATVEDPVRPKKVLLLGAGRVSDSVVAVLDQKNHEILVLSDNEEDARRVASLAKRGRHAASDLSDSSSLSRHVRDADVVVSLLPAKMHTRIAEECIESQTDLVTASYESDEMRQLNDSAKQAGIIIVNEVGLDPGLDHMSAMKIIDDIKTRGGKVTCFKSVCGGLPSPEAANNPLKYKFSWNPKGVISASQNSARYRLNDSILEVDGQDLLSSAVPFVVDDATLWPDLLDLECLPNRDSLHYEDIYDIRNVSTLFRGTLRYRGFSDLMGVFQKMGLFDDDSMINNNWTEVLDALAHRRGMERIEDYVLKCSGNDRKKAQEALETLCWLGMITRDNNNEINNTTLNTTATASMKDPTTTIVDTFCEVLESKLRFEESERDLVLMHHDIRATFVNNDDNDSNTIIRKEEFHTSSLQVFGDEHMSAMCRTVGTPTAIAADLLVGGKIPNRSDNVGLLLPTNKNLYTPILEAAEKEGIIFNEKVFVEETRKTSSSKKQQLL